MKDLITISEAAAICGVHVDTMRRWEQCGHLTPHYTKGGHRRYLLSDLKPYIVPSEIQCKSERMERCVDLWEKIKSTHSKIKASEVIDAKFRAEFMEFKSDTDDFVISQLVKEIDYYKKSLEEFVTLYEKVQRLDSMIEAEESFESFNQKQNELCIRMSPQDGSVHEFDDRITSGNGTSFDKAIALSNEECVENTEEDDPLSQEVDDA